VGVEPPPDNEREPPPGADDRLAPPDDHHRSPPDDRRAPAHPDLLRTRGRVVVGLAFFALYALTFGLRGHVASGLVGGALGGFLVFLLLREAEHRRRRRS
jgi:hypothetical protein